MVKREPNGPGMLSPRRLVLLALFVSVWGGLVFGFWPRTRLLNTPEVLAQLGRAFRLYARQDESGLLPPKNAAPGVFMPSFEALGSYLPAGPDGGTVAAYLRGECGVDVCYTGYFLTNMQSAAAFFDAVEEGNPALPEEDLPSARYLLHDAFWLGPAQAEKTTRLREGCERFLLTDIGNPVAGANAGRLVDVLWEMPDRRQPAGGWVLHLDGKAEWVPYPGKFPMRRDFIERIRKLMDAPGKGESTTKARLVSRPPSPREVEEGLPAPRRGGFLRELDPRTIRTWPTVEAGKNRGYRYRDTLVLFPEDAAVPSETKDVLWPSREDGQSVRSFGTPTFLGTGHGFQWFGVENTEWQLYYRAELGLEGGDDLLDVMISEGRIDLMPLLGGRAVNYLTSVVRGSEAPEVIADALASLGAIDTPEAPEGIAAAFRNGNPHAVRNAEAFLGSCTRSLIYGWRIPRVRDNVLRQAVNVLLLAYSDEELARTAARFTLEHQGVKADCIRPEKVAELMLRTLPRGVYDRPLEELAEVSEEQRNGRRYPYAVERWDGIRATLRKRWRSS